MPKGPECSPTTRLHALLRTAAMMMRRTALALEQRLRPTAVLRCWGAAAGPSVRFCSSPAEPKSRRRIAMYCEGVPFRTLQKLCTICGFPGLAPRDVLVKHLKKYICRNLLQLKVPARMRAPDDPNREWTEEEIRELELAVRMEPEEKIEAPIVECTSKLSFFQNALLSPEPIHVNPSPKKYKPVNRSCLKMAAKFVVGSQSECLPPAVGGGAAMPDFSMSDAEAMLVDLADERPIPQRTIHTLMHSGYQRLSQLTNVCCLSSGDEALGRTVVYNIVGGVNGDFAHLLHIFSEAICGFPSATNRYVFLGNICSPPGGSDVDSLRCMVALLAVQAACPDAITMLAGAAELQRRVSNSLSANDGTVDHEDDRDKYASPAHRVARIARALPLCAILDDSLFLSHQVPRADIMTMSVDGINNCVNRTVDLKVPKVSATRESYAKRRIAAKEKELEMLRAFLTPCLGLSERKLNLQRRSSVQGCVQTLKPVHTMLCYQHDIEQTHAWSFNNHLLELRSHKVQHEDEKLTVARIAHAREKKIELTSFLSLGGKVA